MEIHIEHKRYDGEPLFLDFHCKIDEGAFVALSGPSGVGKTTLLRLLAGLEPDWQGAIDGVNRDTVGYMFQEARLMPWLTALDNLTLFGASKRAAEDALDRVGLSDAAAKYPRALSGGMQRRVALARLLLARPKLVLLDEPFTSLDGQSAEICRQLISALHKECNATVVLVTHSLDDALSLADEVLVMSGRPAQICERIALPSDADKGAESAFTRRIRDDLSAYF